MMIQNEMDYEENEEFPVESDEEGQNTKTSSYHGTQLLILLQITVCAVIICAVLVLKCFGGNLYTAFYDWYNKEINNSVTASENLDAYKEVLNIVLPPQKGTQAPSSSAGN